MRFPSRTRCTPLSVYRGVYRANPLFSSQQVKPLTPKTSNNSFYGRNHAIAQPLHPNTSSPPPTLPHKPYQPLFSSPILMRIPTLHIPLTHTPHIRRCPSPTYSPLSLPPRHMTQSLSPPVWTHPSPRPRPSPPSLHHPSIIPSKPISKVIYNPTRHDSRHHTTPQETPPLSGRKEEMTQ